MFSRDPSADARIVEQAVARGITRYIAAREKKIAPFVERHYSFRGALRIHSHAIGWDLVRVPLNIGWSLVNVALALVGALAKLLGQSRLHERIKRIPPGLETDMDRQIKWLVITELLELPYADRNRATDNDALMKEIVEDPELRTLIHEGVKAVGEKHSTAGFKEEFGRKLAEFGASRTAAADLASSVMVLLSSQVALGQPAYGALSGGSVVAAALAKSIAVSNFWLGATAGSYFYAVVPVAASLRLVIAVTAVFAIILALLSTFIGIVIDPLQAKFGIHQRRLRGLINSIKRDLDGNGTGNFQLRDKYVGRLLDIVDFLSFLRRSV